MWRRFTDLTLLISLVRQGGCCLDDPSCFEPDLVNFVCYWFIDKGENVCL